MNLNDLDVMVMNFQPGEYMRRIFFFSDIGGSEKKQQHKSDPCNNLTEISARFEMAQRSRRDLSETDL